MEGKKFIYSLIDCVQRLGLGIKDRREESKEKKTEGCSLWTLDLKSEERNNKVIRIKILREGGCYEGMKIL